MSPLADKLVYSHRKSPKCKQAACSTSIAVHESPLSIIYPLRPQRNTHLYVVATKNTLNVPIQQLVQQDLLSRIVNAGIGSATCRMHGRGH